MKEVMEPLKDRALHAKVCHSFNRLRNLLCASSSTDATVLVGDSERKI